MRKRYPIAIGGGVALLVAMQYLDFDLGFRGGDGSVVSTQSPASSTPAAVESDVPDSETTPSETPIAVTVPKVVDVLIDENLYLVVRDANHPDKREPMDLDSILSFAKEVSGEESGIRIRIARTPKAIASAEEAILRRLSEAGIDADEIDARRQLVE